MANTELPLFQELPSDLMEEHKICRENAGRLEDNVWKTATIFGGGSLVGIIVLMLEIPIQVELKPLLTFIISLLVVGFLLAWWRFVRRWLSIQKVMRQRMQDIEKQSQHMRNTLYVRFIDDFKQNNKSVVEPYLHKDFSDGLKDPAFLKDYEVRGIRPMMEFIAFSNIVAWVIIAILQIPALPKSLQLITHSFNLELTLVVIVSFLLLAAYIGFVLIQWSKP